MDNVKLDFSKFNGLLPAVVQDHKTGEVLMVAFMNEEAWQHTVKSGKATFWSRSRQELWKKGESSGNVQEVKQILLDCDLDTVVLKVNQVGGAACHEGYPSCFYRTYKNGEMELNQERVFDPKEVYGK